MVACCINNYSAQGMSTLCQIRSWCEAPSTVCRYLYRTQFCTVVIDLDSGTSFSLTTDLWFSIVGLIVVDQFTNMLRYVVKHAAVSA
ncbi:hypothetical protein D3C73_1403480 [compost metagenome]